MDLFLSDKDFVSALTLAGAAEEVAGKLLERKGKKNMLQNLHAWYQDTTGAKIDFREFARKASLARNTLKHANEPNEDEVEMQRWEAVQMIMRAMTNYKDLAGTPSAAMEKMAAWIASRRGAYETME
ncbi:MAG: hypothetical protein AB1898_28440 [Acidobacteriota bacterium]